MDILDSEIIKKKSAYNVVFGYKIKGLLNINNLKNAIKKIIQKHSILRTQFILDLNCSFPQHLKQILILLIIRVY